MGSDVVVTVIHIEVLKNDVGATHNDGGAVGRSSNGELRWSRGVRC